MQKSNIVIGILLASTITFGALYYRRVTFMKTCWQEVPPTEDLMREHGILNRILRIYEKVEEQIATKQPINNMLLADAAIIIRDFIHNYHEKLEENYLFPLFEKPTHQKEAHPLSRLTGILRSQHAAGRLVTDMIIYRATLPNVNDPENLKKLAEDLKGFVGMYRPHENREDTELFPEVRKHVTEGEFERLTDLFEDTEHEKFGKDAYEKLVHRVAEMEKALGIFNISEYTAHAV